MQEVRIPWPDWQIIKKLGNGSYGSVYEIERKDKFGNIENAALKVMSIPKEESDISFLLAEGYTDEEITTYYEDCLENVLKEYAMMVKLKGHPNIVSCEDRKAEVQENGIGWNVYIRMELLTSFINAATGKTFSAEETVKLGKDLCKALIACHSRNIIHRDIKPENIFVTEYGDYKLGDFGVARIMSHTTNATRTGTPYYMAPEVCKDEPYGKEADIYSLGMVMYWMMNRKRLPLMPTEKQPTAAEREKAYKRRIEGEEIDAPLDGNDELKRIILQATAYDPADRYHSAEDLLRDLESLKKEGTKPEEAVIVEEPYEEETDQTLDIYHVPKVRKDAEKEQIQKEELVAEQNPEPEETVEIKEPIEEEIDATVDVYQVERLRRKAEEEEKTEEEQKLPEENTESVPESTCEDSAEDTDGESIPEHEEEEIPEKTNETIGAEWKLPAGKNQKYLSSPSAEGTYETDTKSDDTNKAIKSIQVMFRIGEYEEIYLNNIRFIDDYAPASVSVTSAKAAISAVFKKKELFRLPKDIIAVSSQADYCVYLRSDGTAVARGANNYGQCNMQNWTDLVAIATGYYHTVGLKADGTVVARGNNLYKQCSVFTWNGWSDIRSIAAQMNHTIGLKKDGTVIATGNNYYGECNVSNWTDIIAISAGLTHTVGLKSDGTVVAVGKTDDGQCDVSKWENVVAITTGVDHTVGLREDGTVLAVGDNTHGQCDVSAWKGIIAVAAGYKYTLGWNYSGLFVFAGEINHEPITEWKAIATISTALCHKVCLNPNGTVTIKGVSNIKI